jgi:hypothetical protein
VTGPMTGSDDDAYRGIEEAISHVEPPREKTVSSTSPDSEMISPIKWEPETPAPIMRQEAFQGLLGEIIECLSPTTQADPNALLLMAIAMIGNIAGPETTTVTIDKEHPARLFFAIVGKTNFGAKGTAQDCVNNFFA